MKEKESFDIMKDNGKRDPVCMLIGKQNTHPVIRSTSQLYAVEKNPFSY